MERSLSENDWEFSSSLTLVLVGRKGNGKSATGNSILGSKIFQSERSSSCVTTTSQMKITKLQNGKMLNVIDTPGLSNSSVDTEVTANEIINLAVNGIHAFLVVFSVRSRFSQEEESTISSLLALFGSKINDYMIVVFTGGDQLEDDGMTLEDFLCECPQALKETLSLCENSCILFDNKMKDQTKSGNQVEKLFHLVNMLSRKNYGIPYNKEMFTEFKEQAEKLQTLLETRRDAELEISVLKDEMHEEQFKQVIGMVELNLKETTLSLERQLTEERAARIKAEEDAAKAATERLDEENRYMKMQLAEMKVEEELGSQRVEGRHWWSRENFIKQPMENCFIL